MAAEKTLTDSGGVMYKSGGVAFRYGLSFGKIKPKKMSLKMF